MTLQRKFQHPKLTSHEEEEMKMNGKDIVNRFTMQKTTQRQGQECTIIDYGV